MKKELKILFENDDWKIVQWDNEYNLFRIISKNKKLPGLGIGIKRATKDKKEKKYVNTIIWYIGKPKSKPWYQVSYYEKDKDYGSILEDVKDDLLNLLS